MAGARARTSARTLEVVAPFGVLVVVAIWADLPDLALLLAVMGLYMFPAKSGDPLKVPDALEKHSMVAAMKEMDFLAVLPVALVVASLVGLAVGLPTQFAMVLMGVGAYVVLKEFGRVKPGKVKKTCDEPSPAVKHKVGVHKFAKSSKLAKSSSDALGEHTGVKACESDAAQAPDSLEAQIDAFVKTSAPTANDDHVFRKLQRAAKRCILSVVPEADIRAFANSSLRSIDDRHGKAEAEMVVTCDPQTLRNRLAEFFSRGTSRTRKSGSTLTPELLQKTATKVLSERLTFVRFWRSQFVGPEPKIVLMIPEDLGFFEYPLLLNFHVNSPYPVRLSRVLTNGSQTQAYLTLLVVRWARNRAVSNASKGHPPSYMWSLMVMHFMRENQGALSTDITACFRKIVGFYAPQFKVPEVPVLSLLRIAPDLSAQNSLDIPYIGDPFDAKESPSKWMTSEGVERVSEELRRASALLNRDDATLAELMQHWVPGEATEAH